MTVFLNLLFVLVAVLFFAGRLYEVIFLLEEGTGFLSQSGIVTTPLMLVIVLLISICCGVLIYADKRPQDKKLKIPVSFFGFGAAVLFVITSILNLIRIFTVTGGFLGYDFMMILASAGLAMYGMKGIKGKKSEKLPMVLTIMFPIAMCMNAVVINVQPIADTFFFYRSLSAVTNLIFFILLFKNAYSPSYLARPMLYVSGLMNFLISTAATLAGIIGGIAAMDMPLADITMNLALVIIGAYSLFTAFYIMPSEEAAITSKTGRRKPVEQPVQEYDEYDEYSDYQSTQFVIPVSEPAHENPVFAQDTQTRQISKISEDTIAMLFARKDEQHQQSVVDSAVNQVTAEIAVTQAVEKQTKLQDSVSFDDKDSTRVIKRSASKSEKNIFRGSGGKKTTATKTVYRAPKK